MLDDTEVAAANAREDLTAWKNNAALHDVPHRLLLKEISDPTVPTSSKALEGPGGPDGAGGRGRVQRRRRRLEQPRDDSDGAWRYADVGGGPWAAITPHRSGGAGIDQLFLRVDSDGRPLDLIVAEANFGHGRLGETAVGRQMSDAWTLPRLAATARDYARAADALRAHGTGNAVCPGARALAVPVPGVGTALIVVDDERVSIRCRRSRVTSARSSRSSSAPRSPVTGADSRAFAGDELAAVVVFLGAALAGDGFAAVVAFLGAACR